MDPLTQGVVGAALPAALNRFQTKPAIAAMFGLFAGMAPDLDVLIRSEADPLIYLEYHRQFTHSLLFIPIGAAIMAMLLHLVFGRRWELPFVQTYFFCALGWATHGLLDACTSYGTQLFWPFSTYRVSFDIISIIDPVFTIPLLVLVLTSAIRGTPLFARIGVVYALCYFALGTWQQTTALQMGRALAESRGHTAEQLSAKPSFANLVVWKTLYRDGDTYYVDAVRTLFGRRVYEGTSIVGLDLDRDMPWLDRDSQQAVDIERFRWFSQGYVALDPSNPYQITDLRYSLIPNEITGLWSIALDPAADATAHADFVTHRGDAGGRFDDLWGMITGP